MVQVLRLFTSESADDIRNKGGSYAWKLNTSKANLCSYAVLFHNARARKGVKAETHGQEFLIGRISALEPHQDGRYAVKFDAIAEPSETNFWPKEHQNPVNYAEMDSEAFENLAFEQLRSASRNEEPIAQPGLTIAAAKELLATHYGVKPEAIEIIIRG